MDNSFIKKDINIRHICYKAMWNLSCQGVTYVNECGSIVEPYEENMVGLRLNLIGMGSTLRNTQAFVGQMESDGLHIYLVNIEYVCDFVDVNGQDIPKNMKAIVYPMEIAICSKTRIRKRNFDSRIMIGNYYTGFSITQNGNREISYRTISEIFFSSILTADFYPVNGRNDLTSSGLNYLGMDSLEAMLEELYGRKFIDTKGRVSYIAIRRCNIMEFFKVFKYSKITLDKYDKKVCETYGEKRKLGKDGIFVENIEISKEGYYIQKTGDVAVIRCFIESGYCNPMEYMRILVFPDGKVKTYRKVHVGWIPIAPEKLNISMVFGLDALTTLGFDEGLDETYLRYFDNFDNDSRRILVPRVLFPFLENIVAMGYIDHFAQICKVAELNYHTIEHFFHKIFGKVDWEQRAFYKAIGIPSFMANQFLKLIYFDFQNILNFEFIGNLKRVCGDKFLTHMNKELFEILLNYFIRHDKDMFDILCLLIKIYGTGSIKKYIKKAEEIFNASKHKEYLVYLTAVDSIRNKYPNYEWNISVADIERLCEEVQLISEIENCENAEMRRCYEFFAQADTMWEKYNFIHKDLCIIYPKSPQDIIKEGIQLHHCAKSYVHAIYEGITTILFIRRKEEPEKSYFTLEIRDGKVRQCHGQCNCEMTDEIEDFLWSFCKEKGIEYNYENCILAV